MFQRIKEAARRAAQAVVEALEAASPVVVEICCVIAEAIVWLLSVLLDWLGDQFRKDPMRFMAIVLEIVMVIICIIGIRIGVQMVKQGLEQTFAIFG